MLNHRSLRAQRGVTIIELMVGLLVSLIVAGASVAAYITTFRGGTDVLRSARLNQELGAVVDLMAADIRRAGYIGDEGGVQDANIRLDSARIVAFNGVANGCLLYRYLADATTPANSYFGFRRNGNVVQMRTAGTVINDCTNGTWETITDPSTVTITALEFYAGVDATQADAGAVASGVAASGSKCIYTEVANTPVWPTANTTTSTFPCDDTSDPNNVAGAGRVVERRQVVIVLKANHSADSDFTVTRVESVNVRNDRIFTK